MSASDQKNAAIRRLRALEQQYTDILVGNIQDPLDVMRLNQGIIQGLKMAMTANEEAFTEVGL